MGWFGKKAYANKANIFYFGTPHLVFVIRLATCDLELNRSQYMHVVMTKQCHAL